jgi:methylmalonyl-CoA/ethylmalonyl-CoA epimerase
MLPFPLDHIAIALHDEVALSRWQAAFGLASFHNEEVSAQGVRVYFFQSGGTTLEILLPLTPDSPVGRFIAKKGGGLHHLAFYAEDLQAARIHLEGLGFEALSQAPQPAARGKQAYFFHPRSADGVLVELVSRAS